MEHSGPIGCEGAGWCVLRKRMVPAGLSLAVLLALLAGIGPQPAAGADPDARTRFQLVSLQAPFAVRKLERVVCPAGPTVRATDEEGHAWRITAERTTLIVQPLPDCPQPAPVEHRDMLEQGVVAQGTANIAQAWLAVPTLRYRHGTMGDVVSAAELRLLNRNGDTARYALPETSVFEDRLVRLVEVDRRDMALVVLTSLEDGAALALFDLQGDSIVPAAQSKPLGAGRWLNPVGVGDFDGRGHPLFAAVLDPHDAGTLVVYRREGARLVRQYSAPDFSNHELFSGELGMSAMLDATGDGVPDLAIPNSARTALRVVTFDQGRFAQLFSQSLDAEVVTAVIAADLNGNGKPDLVFGLKNQKLIALLR